VLNLKKIAITGEPSTGKSTVCLLFEKYGAKVIDSDKIIHELLHNSERVKKKVIALLGQGVAENDKIDRKKIAKIVFNNATKLEKLEKILHPYVFKAIEEKYKSIEKNKSYLLFVVEIPLLYETSHQDDYDNVVVVTSNEGLCRNRWRKKYKNLDDYYKRKSRQLPHKEKYGDFVIENNKTLEELEKEVEKLTKIIVTQS
jgi:dephospho-CoA kinase